MAYYDAISDGYDELHGEEQANKFARVLSKVQLHEKTKSLDVGCGTGLSRKHIPGKITGIDPAKKPLLQAKRRLDHVILGSGEKLPLKDRSFDLVFAMTVVHNFTHPAAGIEEVRRVADMYAVISVLKESKKYKDIIRTIERVFIDWNMLIIDSDPYDVIFILTRSPNQK